jgi:hypothetical protein
MKLICLKLIILTPMLLYPFTRYFLDAGAATSSIKIGRHCTHTHTYTRI